MSFQTDQYPSASLIGGYSVTPSDSIDLTIPTRQIYVAAAGNVRVTFIGYPDGTYSTHAVLAGERLNWQVKRIWSTGTTATGIEGFY